MKVIALAQDFGFGPISMLNRAVLNLPGDIEVDYWVREHLRYVLDPRPGTEVRAIDSEAAVMQLPLEEYHAAFIACDYPMADAILERVAKVIVYDMLFWFWPELHDVLHKDVLIIAQNFIGVEERAKDFRSVKVVGPLLPNEFFKPFNTRKRDGVLVNLGGFQSPHHTRREAEAYLSNLHPLLIQSLESGHDLCIAGGSLILDHLSASCPLLAPYTEKLKHGEIRERMASAGLYLTTPGLGSIYESFFIGAPTYFLPPTNFTQVLQFEGIASHVPSCCGFRLSALSNGSLADEEEGGYIRSLFEFYRSQASRVREVLLDDFNGFAAHTPDHFQEIAKEGRDFVEHFGGPGENLARAYVEEYLNA